MNRYHRRCCRSPGWSAFMAGTVLPRALDGIDLGPGCSSSARVRREHQAAGHTGAVADSSGVLPAARGPAPRRARLGARGTR